MHSFLYCKPGAPHWDRRLGIEIYWSLKGITHAALYVRKNGPAYLRALSVYDIRQLLTEFIQENYWYVSEDTFLKRFNESFAERVSEKAKVALAEALARSSVFDPVMYPTLFPLVPIRVETCFSSPAFFLRKPEALLDEFPPARHRWLDAKHFPPLIDTKARKEMPTSWLGVRAPVKQAAQKAKAAVLGAAALTITDGYRYMFSFGEPHTPPLMHDMTIRGCDTGWLSTLATKLSSIDENDQRQVRALEYFYRAWDQKSHERFPWHCMALEAAFSKKGATTKSVIEGVRDTLGPHIDPDRVRQILRVRGAVIHGEAPDVFDADEYEAYYDAYSADPIDDLALLTAACLRHRIFGGTMIDQEEPHKEIIAEAQARGRLPKRFRSRSILDRAEASQSQAGDGVPPPIEGQ
jgi:hypothetical protein